MMPAANYIAAARAARRHIEIIASDMSGPGRYALG